MMDNRSRELGKVLIGGGRGREEPDWDWRGKDRIQHVDPEGIGYQKVLSLSMNGAPQTYKADETILEVKLSKPIMPRSTVVFQMKFEAQVPLQVRRSGRGNPQAGGRYSMSPWYPKICEYDYESWHPNPYLAKEVYWGLGDYVV